MHFKSSHKSESSKCPVSYKYAAKALLEKNQIFVFFLRDLKCKLIITGACKDRKIWNLSYNEENI